MSHFHKFEQIFSQDSLKKIFEEYISHKSSTGIDNRTAFSFSQDLDNQVSIINRKVLDGTYKFSNYKQKLISKGANKYPRVISIPTVRDKLVLKTLQIFLHQALDKHINLETPQALTRKVKKSLTNPEFDKVLKLDISEFYPSIRHEELKLNLGKFIRSEKQIIIGLIMSAIKAGTGAEDKNEKGVPQGLAISNILAYIYFKNIDQRFFNSTLDIEYFRYVDDVMIIGKNPDVIKAEKDYIKRCKLKGLRVHNRLNSPEKCVLIDKGDTFSFLGYLYYPEKPNFNKTSKPIISVREQSLNKLRSSIVGLFISFQRKEKTKEYLRWRLNLRITGCIIDNTRKGWLAFFSEIDDLDLLFTLDHFVEKMISDKRFSDSKLDIKPCSFVKTYYEIKYKQKHSKYIPNFDDFTIEAKKEVLNKLGVDFKKNDDNEIESKFWKTIRRETKDLDQDLLPVS